MAVEPMSVRCCIAGGGPAGMMLGLLLARAGVATVVLERHDDFLRDFRGDTIHPSTLELMYELGVLEEFLKLPHQEARELSAQIDDRSLPFADFRHLPTRCKWDAAHAMSPIGGVGINLAIQDAVAAANLLAEPLRLGRLTTDHLRLVQRRRELPTRITQRLQVLIQRRVITRILSGADQLEPPLLLRLLARFPVLRRLPARLIGVGIRPEHVTTPAVAVGVRDERR